MKVETKCQKCTAISIVEIQDNRIAAGKDYEVNWTCANCQSPNVYRHRGGGGAGSSPAAPGGNAGSQATLISGSAGQKNSKQAKSQQQSLTPQKQDQPKKNLCVKLWLCVCLPISSCLCAICLICDHGSNQGQEEADGEELEPELK